MEETYGGGKSILWLCTLLTNTHMDKPVGALCSCQPLTNLETFNATSAFLCRYFGPFFVSKLLQLSRVWRVLSTDSIFQLLTHMLSRIKIRFSLQKIKCFAVSHYWMFWVTILLRNRWPVTETNPDSFVTVLRMLHFWIIVVTVVTGTSSCYSAILRACTI